MFLLLPDDNPALGGASDDTGSDNQPAAPETTTPEEVKSILGKSGMSLPAEPTAAEDDEEGDEPDAPLAKEDDAAGEGQDAEEIANEDPIEPEEEDKPEPATDKVEDAPSADDDKYSFTVEDANGVTYKITAGAKMSEVLDGFELKNDGQALDILKELQKVETQKESDEAASQDKAAKAEHEQNVANIRKGWEKEVAGLAAEKRIPEGDDGEARIAEVYKFMHEENGKRIEANRPTIGSFEDALDKLENKEARDAKDKASKEAKDKARENGGKVGGSSAPATSSAPVYKGGARNANEAIKVMGLL
jgi:hypothetical protein